MEILSSNIFLQSLPAYNNTQQQLYHPTFGTFTVLQDSHGSKILKKLMSAQQLSRMDNDLLLRYQHVNNPYILQIKGIAKEDNGCYAVYYEHFDSILKEEIEEKASEGVRYTAQQVLNILQDISRGLSLMQANKIVHGEVKSSNIVRVGNDYKLLCPVFFGKNVPQLPNYDPKAFVRMTDKIVTPDLMNGAYRDIIDPVHEDHKDDVYGLGLVALDMMTLRVEAPIPVQKRLESSNLLYSNNLLRLINKMVEGVLALRLDPVACKEYIEKIYASIIHESTRPPLCNKRNLNALESFNMMKKGASEGMPHVQLLEPHGRSQSISQQPSPAVSRVTRHDSYTEPKSLVFSYVLPDDIRRSPSYLVDDTSLTGKDGLKRSEQVQENQVMQELDWMKNYASGTSSRDENCPRPRKNSETASSMLSTHMTYNFGPIRKDILNETKSNIWDLSHMSPTASEAAPEKIRCTVEFGSMEVENKYTEESHSGGERDMSSKPPRDVMRRVSVPAVKVTKEILSKGGDREKNENTPRFKEGNHVGKGGEEEKRSQSQVSTSRIPYGENQDENQHKTMDSQRTQKYVASPAQKLNFGEELRSKENIIIKNENRCSSVPRNSGELGSSGKRVLKLKKSFTPLGKKDIDVITIRCNLSNDIDVRCSESYIADDKDVLPSDLHKEKIAEESESISIYVHKPVVMKENRVKSGEKVVKTQPMQVNVNGGLRRVLSELKDDQAKNYSKQSSESYLDSLSQTKDTMGQSQVGFEYGMYSSNLFPKPNSLNMRVCHSQPMRESQMPRKVTEKTSDGCIFEGEMVGYVKQGQGKLTYPDGKYYEGDWKDGKISGFGILYSEKGAILYKGYWQDGKYYGQGLQNNTSPSEGHMLWEDQIRIPIKELGSWKKYEGEFAEDNWNGFGELSLANGDRYIGRFEASKANGQGKYISKDGRMWEGEWQQNYLTKLL